LKLQRHACPDLLLSISPSTLIRPSSDFAFSFQLARPEQLSLVRTSPLPPSQAPTGATSATGT